MISKDRHRYLAEQEHEERVKPHDSVHSRLILPYLLLKAFVTLSVGAHGWNLTSLSVTFHQYW